MKLLAGFLVFMVFLSQQSLAQESVSYQVKLPITGEDIAGRLFFVNKIEDHRSRRDSIGTVHIGEQNQTVPADLAGGVSASLMDYFLVAMPEKPNQIPIKIFILELVISEKIAPDWEYGAVELKLAFYHQNQFVFEGSAKREVQGLDVTILHGLNLDEALHDVLEQFNRSWQMKEILGIQSGVTYYELPESNVKKRDAEEVISALYTARDRNVVVVGYQIGGWCLVGFDYEFRVADHIGLHLGGGFFGMTAGVKVHPNTTRDGGFFNFSWKDGGFGLINSLGIEYGARKAFKGDKMAMYGQVGVARIVSIDDEFEDQLFGSEGAPDAMLSLGIGLSW